MNTSPASDYLAPTTHVDSAHAAVRDFAQLHARGSNPREQAVALLKEASGRGMLELGPSHAFHIDLLLAPLRGYPPFEALLTPDD